MDTINEVGSTAFFISYMRSLEKKQKQPLFKDPYADWFVSEALSDKIEGLASLFPPFQELIRYRVCALNEVLKEEIKNGIQQIVVLGSGFDMRFKIFEADKVKFCDVDQPTVLDFKRKVLQAHGAEPCLEVPCNYLEVDLPQKLSEVDLDLQKPILFIWEGNTMYLPSPLIHNFLDQLCASIPSFTIAFDYLSDKIIQRTTGNDEVNQAVDSFEESFGVKWYSGFGNLSVFEEKHPLKVAKTETVIDLARRLQPETTDIFLSEMDFSPDLLNLYSYGVLTSN